MLSYDELQMSYLGCALGPDLALLPQGDMTEVGEKGKQICCFMESRFLFKSRNNGSYPLLECIFLI